MFYITIIQARQKKSVLFILISVIFIIMSNGCASNELYEACFNGDINKVKSLIDKKVNVNQSALADTPLCAASLQGHKEIVKILLDNGANTEAGFDGDSNPIDTEYTPLYAAALNGHTEIVKMLLEHNAKIESKFNKKFTSLYVASKYGHTETVKILLEHGANVNGAKDGGYAPLYTAAYNGNIEVVKLLLEKGANINAALKNYGDTPLYAASEQGHGYIVSLLIKNGAEIQSKTKADYTALYTAINNNNFDIAENLIIHGEETLLIDKYPQDKYCKAVLHEIKAWRYEMLDDTKNAIENYRIAADIFKEVSPELKKMVKYLSGQAKTQKFIEGVSQAFAEGLVQGAASSMMSYQANTNNMQMAQINALNSAKHAGSGLSGYSHAMTLYSDMEQPSATVSFKNNRNKFYTSDSDKVTMLKSLSSQFNQMNKYSEECSEYCQRVLECYNDVNQDTPLEDQLREIKRPVIWDIMQQSLANSLCVASCYGDDEEVRNLLARGVSCNMTERNSEYSAISLAAENGYLEIVKILIEHGADINVSQKNSPPPLYIASQEGNTDIVKYLLEKGANIEARFKEQYTSLLVASKNNHIEVVKLLLDYGGDINTASDNGITPLYMASECGYTELVEILIEHGANINLKNKEGMIPLDIATKNEHTEIIKLLQADMESK